MSHTATTLQRIIDNSFDGKNSLFAEKSGIPASNVTRLCKGGMPLSPASLAKACLPLLPDEVDLLCRAFIRDSIPPEAARRILDTSNTVQDSGATYGSDTDPEIRRILQEFADDAAQNPETHRWLLRMGHWMGVTPVSDQKSDLQEDP